MVAVVAFQLLVVTQLARDVELALVLFVFAMAAPKRWVAAAIGLAAVANMDAIPVIAIVGGQRRALPLACLAMCIGLLARNDERPQLQPRRVLGWAAVMSFIVISGVVRPSFFGSARTLENSLDVSMPTLILVIGAPLLAASLRADGIWRISALVVLGSVVVHSVLRVGLFILGDPQGLIQKILHPTVVRAIDGSLYTGGAARVVASPDHLVGWATCLLLAFALIGTAKYRKIVLAMGAATALALLLTYARALYIAAAITLIWTLIFGLRPIAANVGAARFRNLRAFLLSTAGGFLLIALATGQGGSILTRTTQIFSGSSDHNTALRAQAISTLTSYMRGIGDWLFGLGFLSPLDRFDARMQLAGGMYSSDLGFAAVVMPLGLVGLAGILIGVVALARSSTRTLGEVYKSELALPPELGPALLGTASFCVSFIASGATVYLPMDGAPVPVALAFGLGINAISEAAAALKLRAAEPAGEASSEPVPPAELRPPARSAVLPQA